MDCQLTVAIHRQSNTLNTFVIPKTTWTSSEFIISHNECVLLYGVYAKAHEREDSGLSMAEVCQQAGQQSEAYLHIKARTT